MIARRDFIFALGALAMPRVLLAQSKVWRIGFLYSGSRQTVMDRGRYAAFLQGMRELGYVEGKHFVIEARFASGSEVERVPALAAELVHANVDVIVSNGTSAAQALKRETSTIPVVVTLTNDFVGEGLAASLAHPGGNFTGLGGFTTEVSPKHIEMLKLVVPNLASVACLAHSRNSMHPVLLKHIEAAAGPSAIRVLSASVDSLDGIERSVGDLSRRRAQALIILSDAFFSQYLKQIAAFCIQDRLASVYWTGEYPEAGGLMSYGPNIRENYRRAATYVDKIFKGANPGDLPIEQPTKFELVINRRTAGALGMKLSEELLFRADRVIE